MWYESPLCDTKVLKIIPNWDKEARGIKIIPNSDKNQLHGYWNVRKQALRNKTPKCGLASYFLILPHKNTQVLHYLLSLWHWMSLALLMRNVRRGLVTENSVSSPVKVINSHQSIFKIEVIWYYFDVLHLAMLHLPITAPKYPLYWL